ncbi:MAG: methyltransferase domain-containing protein [Ardenticatenales bacterium]|nr:methyltransferase domain-containing protein [Ardenticatenales bacterium]
MHEFRVERALIRQRLHQEQKAAALKGSEEELIASRTWKATQVRRLLESLKPITEDTCVLEVGSGAHGLIFFLGASKRIGIDPLASSYVSLFPAWQGEADTATAIGEALPFPDHSFEVVISDNVVDHAKDPALILAEIARVLEPGGLFYFTVNVHHPIYAWVSMLHAGWQALGIPYELGPFADHTVHLTLNQARHLFEGLPLRIVHEQAYFDESKAAMSRTQPRHWGDRIKRLFFKNVPFEVVATREP